MAALIIGVVYSGLRVKTESLRSLKLYISFKTTSEFSPKGFLNSSEFSNIGVEVPKYGEQFDAYSKYERFIEQLVETKGLKKKTFTAKKGQALIWSANLFHGSIPIKNSNRTRYSQATHYYFDGCSHYYSPMFSDTLRGKLSMKNLDEKDIINYEI